MGAGLSTEGTNAQRPRLVDVLRRDVPTCSLDERLGDVRDRAVALGWDACVVVSQGRVVLGLLRAKELDADPDLPAEHSASRRWTSATAIDPSPMAAEQRLTDPQRTSPAAKTPGRLVSSGSGSLASGQLLPGSRATSLPVIRYPAVLVTNPIPAAPSVRGAPPMQMNKAFAGNGTGSVLSPERTMTARRRSPASRAATCVRTRTSTFGIADT